MLRVVHDVETTVNEPVVRCEEINLDELCRIAARDMIAIALAAERRAYLQAHAGAPLASGSMSWRVPA
jgi:hypothetical protein